MKSRRLVPELMDNPELDACHHRDALRGLERINRCTGNGLVAWRPIRELARRLERDRLRLLDVATGAADIPIELSRRARTEGLALEIDACDVSQRALEVAEQNCARAGTRINLFTLDVVEQTIGKQYDLIMCSQFLHHLTVEQTESVLLKMASAARHRVVVIDLARTRWNWLQVVIATRVLSRSKVVHFDGPQSVRAAYTFAEIRAIASRVGFVSFSIESRWPCRFVLIGDVNE